MIDLTPTIIPYNDGIVKIILSKDFRKLYDAEVDYVEYIMNCYYEDPNHCKIFEFKDVYQFNKELSDLTDIFLFEQLNSSLIENIKIKVEDLCKRFINGDMIAKSIDYYNLWDNEKFK